jgi:hypothetical protein
MKFPRNAQSLKLGSTEVPRSKSHEILKGAGRLQKTSTVLKISQSQNDFCAFKSSKNEPFL